MSLSKKLRFEVFNEVPAWNDPPRFPYPEIRKRGYVYLVWSPKWKLYKIGRTIDLKRRMYQLQSERPFERLRLVYAAEVGNQYETERLLHATVSDKHVLGEWFDLEESDIEEVLTKIQLSVTASLAEAKYLADIEVEHEFQHRPHRKSHVQLKYLADIEVEHDFYDVADAEIQLPTGGTCKSFYRDITGLDRSNHGTG